LSVDPSAFGRDPDVALRRSHHADLGFEALPVNPKRESDFCSRLV
jgi:hypothetical protein